MNTEDSVSELIGGHIMVPENAVIRIFSYVSRGDLENCKLVCRTWKNVIEFADKQKKLQKRPIDALILSTNREFSIEIYSDWTKREYYYKKYFLDKDIDELEIKRVGILPSPFDEYMFRFPCDERFPVHVSKKMTFKPADPFHHEFCKARIQPQLYRHKNTYKRKLFTPPLAFYERLEHILKFCKVKRLVFHGFTFTDLFVEKLLEYARSPLQEMTSLVMHCCNLRCISPTGFQKLFANTRAQDYFIERLRNCIPNHLGPEVLFESAIRSARIFFVGALTSRFGTPVILPIDDDVFRQFIKEISCTDTTGRREFFGISSSRISRTFKVEYEKLIKLASKKHNLYKHVLIGEERYLPN